MSDHINSLIAFLSKPESYPQPDGQIEIVQTHASVLAIGQKYVFKVKKPVNFEFMDFSTVEKRLFYCEEEVRLNQRLTTGIYLEIVPIYHDPAGAYTFSNYDQPVDYAVKMKRMSEEGFLSKLIDDDKLIDDHFDLIVEKLCAFYRSLPSQEINDEYGTKESISYIIDENTHVRRQFLGKTLDPLQEEIISDYQQTFLKTQSELFAQRKRKGWIRDTHGDLRLEHFHFESDQLNIYDCIEFKERLRVNDLVNDFAFLNMELDHVGLTTPSYKMYQSLIKCTGDEINLGLWIFYKIHRACVRGMVHSVAAYESEQDPQDQERNRLVSEKFFGQATRYVVLMNKPTVFAVFGGVATGKSTVSGNLARMLSIPHVQSDVTRKELFGIKPDEFLTDESREQLYSKEMTNRTYEEVVKRGVELVKKYNAVILDGRWSKPEQRDILVKSFKDVRIVWVQATAPREIRESRLKEREFKKSISDARLDIFKQLVKDEVYDDQYHLQNVVTVDTSDTLPNCLKTIVDAITD